MFFYFWYSTESESTEMTKELVESYREISPFLLCNQARQDSKFPTCFKTSQSDKTWDKSSFISHYPSFRNPWFNKNSVSVT